jgi:hypothetical protein
MQITYEEHVRPRTIETDPVPTAVVVRVNRKRMYVDMIDLLVWAASGESAGRYSSSLYFLKNVNSENININIQV